MSKKKAARNRHTHPASPPGRGSRSTRSSVAIAILLAAVAVATWWGWTNRRGATPRANRSAGDATAVALSSPESAQRLIGRWQRTDAGYVIDVRSVDRFGTVDAAYLNPNPIHVSQVRASDAEGPLELFIELMDVGYPGATYRLQYNPEYDALVGSYHQPTAGQEFEVAFQRK
jgi:hypothetical protein